MMLIAFRLLSKRDNATYTLPCIQFQEGKHNTMPLSLRVDNQSNIQLSHPAASQQSLGEIHSIQSDPDAGQLVIMY